MKSDNFDLIYEELVFESNLNILCEDINYLHSIITEENFLEVIKSMWNKIASFFSESVNIFKKSFNAIVDFCKKVFQLTYVKDLMNKLGLTDSILQQFIGIVKGSLIVIPVASIRI